MQFFMTLMGYLTAVSVFIATPVVAYQHYLADVPRLESLSSRKAAPTPPKIKAFLERKAIPVPKQEAAESTPPPATEVQIPVVAQQPRERIVEESPPRQEPRRTQRARRAPTVDVSAQSQRPAPAPRRPADIRLMTSRDQFGG